MLVEYFGFNQEPFGASPDPRCLFLSHTHREALASLDYAYLSNRGFTAMIAIPGMGKTTLLLRFLETIRASARSVFLFDIDSRCDPQDLVAYILRDLGIVPGRTNSEMHHQLTDALAAENRAGRKVVIVIDEAQNLSNAMLERIRLLTNFETPRGKLIQIVLSGQPPLADKLTQTSLVQLRQRVASISHLESLSAGEAEAYIKHRLKWAGNIHDELFTKEALALIATASQGIPRIINNICFNALSLCYALKNRQVNRDMVSEVISDLQLLPASLESAAAGRYSAKDVRTSARRTRAKRFRKVWLPAVATLLVAGIVGILGITEVPIFRNRAIDDAQPAKRASVEKPQATQESTRATIRLKSRSRPINGSQKLPFNIWAATILSVCIRSRR